MATKAVVASVLEFHKTNKAQLYRFCEFRIFTITIFPLLYRSSSEFVSFPCNQTILKLKFKQSSLYALGALRLNSYYFTEFYNFIIKARSSDTWTRKAEKQYKISYPLSNIYLRITYFINYFIPTCKLVIIFNEFPYS